MMEVNFRGRDKVRFSDGEEVKEVNDFLFR